MNRPIAFAVVGAGAIVALTAFLALPLLEPHYEVQYYAYVDSASDGKARAILVYDLPGDEKVDTYVRIINWERAGSSTWYESTL